MDRKDLTSNLVIAAIAVLLFSGLSFVDFSLFKGADRLLYDLGQQVSPRSHPSAPIVIVQIGSEDLEALGPCTRPLLAQALEKLRERKAKAIGIDLPLLLAEFHPTLNETKGLETRLKAHLASDPAGRLPESVLKEVEQWGASLDGNLRLEKAIERCGNVVLGLPLRPDAAPSGRKTTPAYAAQARSGGKKTAEDEKVPYAPSEPLLKAAAGLGHLCLTSDKNMRGRSHPLCAVYKGRLTPSYPFRLAMSYLGLEPDEIKLQADKIRCGNRSIPLVKEEMLVAIKDARTYPHLSLSDLLLKDKIPADLQGKVVLIGMDDLERGLAPDAPSQTELTANIIDDLINENYVTRPRLTFYVELTFLFILGALAAFLFTRFEEFERIGILLVLLGLTLAAGIFSLSVMGVWLKTSLILACLTAIYLAISAKTLSSVRGLRQDVVESKRLLGLNYQKQGLPDLAFEQLRGIPLDDDAREIIYNLAQDYESRGKADEALTAYAHISRRGDYRDVAQRMASLRAGSSDAEGRVKQSAVLSDSLIRARKTVGRYQILEGLGKGTMGLIYKALDPRINRLLAIKVIRFSDDFDEELIEEIKERFFREAEIAGRLSHPSIVTIHDVGEDGDLTYMAMEYLEGRDLSYCCKRENLLPLTRALDVAANVAEALDYAHREDVIHRDIKPANIMLLKNNGVKVTDFGIAKAVSSSKTKTGVILGTPNYMSPEQIMGHKIDARTDIFSLGVLFFQLLTGDLPFHGENLSSLLYQITQGQHPSVRQYNSRIPKACDQIIGKALAKKPDERFRTAGAMAKYLRIILSKAEK